MCHCQGYPVFKFFFPLPGLFHKMLFESGIFVLTIDARIGYEKEREKDVIQPSGDGKLFNFSITDISLRVRVCICSKFLIEQCNQIRLYSILCIQIHAQTVDSVQ